ncbi:hypothetical protein ACLOJK_036452 [Asimina triloba]
MGHYTLICLVVTGISTQIKGALRMHTLLGAADFTWVAVQYLHIPTILLLSSVCYDDGDASLHVAVQSGAAGSDGSPKGHRLLLIPAFNRDEDAIAVLDEMGFNPSGIGSAIPTEIVAVRLIVRPIA